MSKGLTHIYFGDGKGKTTAALGLALRASGCGKNVVIVQFLKDWKCGELSSLELLPNVTVFRGKSSGSVYVRDMSDAEKAATKAIHDENLKKALDLHESEKCDMLVLDEAIDAHQLGVLDDVLFEKLLGNKPEMLELVVTGHKPDARLLEHADYVTEMVKRKHPYDKGIEARRGIEF
jgi:cob(I)alamin adenosyltransferase